MKKLSREIIEEFSFTNEQIRDFYEMNIPFSGEICWRCNIYANVPRVAKYWKCHRCENENKFDPINITIPFDNPDVGPTRSKIDFIISIKDGNNYYNGGGSW